MPSADSILDGLRRISNELLGVAIAWHVVLAVACTALAPGYRPSRRVAAGLLTLPLISVSVVAFAYRNPFNGAVFAALAAVMAIRAVRGSASEIELGPRWAIALGSALVVFGSVYPHFLEGHPAWAYIAGAPLGLVPCPTLAVVLGATLTARGFGDRVGSLVLAAATAFYALFGTVRLGVWLDLPLIVGALALAALVMRTTVQAPRAARA